MKTAQQQQETAYNREEEYLSAQRAAVEAVLVGRETLEVASRQGEQLERAESLADETQYKLDKACRKLRGMTWSGWVANMFAKDVEPPPAVGTSSSRNKEPPLVYENVPESCRGAAQAVQNYHVNVNVLEACETEEQKETCKLICENMYAVASDQVSKLRDEDEIRAYSMQFEADLSILRNRQEASQQRIRGLGTPGAVGKSEEKETASKKETPSSPQTSRQTAPPGIDNPVLQQQEEHLAAMSQNLGELGSIAQSLHQAVDQQCETIDALDTKADHIIEKSKMVTRRADRLVQKKSWSPVKPEFFAHVSIRHLATGRYLSVVSGGDLYLVPKFHPETCVFALWKRQGEIFGLKNKFSDCWVGQNLLGYLACTAYYFGRREEWEADADWNSSRLLCASAGWGAGGYLVVRKRDYAVLIGGSGVEERKKADLWCISEQEEE